jgi:hypothetical protein
MPVMRAARYRELIRPAGTSAGVRPAGAGARLAGGGSRGNRVTARPGPRSVTNGTAISRRGVADVTWSGARIAAPAACRRHHAGGGRHRFLPRRRLASSPACRDGGGHLAEHLARFRLTRGPVTLPGAGSRSWPARRSTPWPHGQGWPAAGRRALQPAALPDPRDGMLGGDGPATSMIVNSSKRRERSAISANLI